MKKIKIVQKDWIGKPEGALIKFQILNSKFQIKIFTTRVDTLFGCTYLVLAPEHQFVVSLFKTKNQKLKIKNIKSVEKYIKQNKKKTKRERTSKLKKTGVELKGIYAINPANNKKIPIWISDYYVVMNYGLDAIMAVPAHNQQDFEFAKKYNLLIKKSVAPYLKDDPKVDKKTEKRDVVVAIVKNPKNNTYLCLKWKTTEWQSFPAGGIDKDNLIDAAKREILEETGYKNLRFIKQIGNSIYAEFYRPHKDSNVFSHFQYLLFDLVNEEMEVINKKEKEQHEAIWIKEDEVDLFINVWNQKLAWKIYKQGELAYTEDGLLVNSAKFTGLKSIEAREKIIKWLKEKKKTQKHENKK